MGLSRDKRNHKKALSKKTSASSICPMAWSIKEARLTGAYDASVPKEKEDIKAVLNLKK